MKRFLVVASFLIAASAAADDSWPSFRGQGARGVADGHATAVTWNVPAGEGVFWKTAIPGLAHSSPAIWGDRLFVTTAVAEDEAQATIKTGYYGDPKPADDNGPQSYRLFSLDTKSGAIVWQRTAFEGTPKVKRHLKSSHANPTPATDGKRLSRSSAPRDSTSTPWTASSCGRRIWAS